VKNRIKELRNERNLSLRELSTFIGLNYSTIACYELEKREPDMDTIKKLTSFFEVSIDYLVCEEKYIYCLYENANHYLSLTKKDYDRLKDYIYINDSNHRCIDINKYLNIKNETNILDFMNEIFTISQFDLLFENKTNKVKEILTGIPQDIILSKELLDKIKELMK